MQYSEHLGFNKYAIICGNGPSLAEIDYKRLPLEYDVFRCNQFYFEDKYYMGKRVKFAFANPSVLFEQSYTYRTLSYTKEYEIDNIVVSNFNLNHIDSCYLQYLYIYDDIICGSRQLARLKDFYAFIRYNELYCERRITSGIYMCAFAVALGYKEIYIAGIDLYSTKEAYAFDIMQQNLLTIVPSFSTTPSSCHAKEIDVEALFFLEQHYNVKFYSVCLGSPLNEYIPLANLHNNTTLQIVQKTEKSIRDMLIPPASAYKKLNYGIEIQSQHNPLDHTKEQQEYKKMLRNNSIYRLYRDFIRFPKAVYYYVKGYKICRKLKQSIKNNRNVI
ncbi:alpha-2,3-sialyltransferase [Helicobacter trogontum]|uniref:Alpha-2,3 sialyltransferase n=1 Tax=Helicobacter trogontum TaxID=50960 RepID=A0A4U8SDC4_9HELI|nr:alpha-2,3-sialyltransferase [Helicobacter trogontum]TLD84148.1 alpha-2,3 sialyltransferase [Helicobacter trogontum]